jgi:hypothetical protein
MFLFTKNGVWTPSTQPEVEYSTAGLFRHKRCNTDESHYLRDTDIPHVGDRKKDQ